MKQVNRQALPPIPIPVPPGPPIHLSAGQLPLTPPNSCSGKNTVQFPSPPSSAALLSPLLAANPLWHSSPSLSNPGASPSAAHHLPAGSSKNVPLERATNGPLSPPPNSIKFPSASPTSTLADNDPPCDGAHELGRAIAHWLTAVYEPAPAPRSPSGHTPPAESFVPEIDILVGCKAITDQLGLPPLSRTGCLEILESHFPLVSPWARPTAPGIRANQELVLRGLKYRSTYGARADEQCTRTAADKAVQRIPFSWDTIDIHEPIPSRHHTPSLIEAMRVRICTLEAELDRLRLSSPTNSLMSTSTCSKLNPEPVKTRHAQSNDVDALETLGSRIWESFIVECAKASNKANFEPTQKKTISWVEELNFDEFKLIARHSRGMRTFDDSHRLTIPHPLLRTSTRLFAGRPQRDIHAALFPPMKSTRIKKLRVKSLNILKSSGYAIGGGGLGGGGADKIEKKKKVNAEGEGGKVVVLEMSIRLHQGCGKAQFRVIIDYKNHSMGKF